MSAADPPPDSVPKADIPPAWRAEFEAAARRTSRQRFRYGFVKTYKPVLDDAEYRSWESTAEYRQWCRDNLPDWLGYGPADPAASKRIRGE